MAERFDVYDAAGHPLGLSKARDEVHRDGDWHRSIALWIVRPDGRLVFQRRSATKDTWPGRLTGSVSGHYAAGETLAEVLREADEEIGVGVSRDDLVPVGIWRNEDRPAPGVIDRELQDVFLWPLDLPLAALRPDPEEVSCLVEMAPADLLALLGGTAAAVEVRCLPAGEALPRPCRVTLEDFVPAHAHHADMARAALDYIAGRTPTLHAERAG
jgi:isopentenyldiphosphate isomerase